jgi:hypothetical protein
MTEQRQLKILLPIAHIAGRAAPCSIARPGTPNAGIPAPAGFKPEFS